MAVHADLTGANLHECKGYDTATAGQIRVANGSGAGVMQKIGNSELDTTEIFDTNKGALVVQMADVTTAEVAYVVMPFTCTVTKVSSVISNAFITADNIVTVANNAGASMGTITIAFSGSAAGDIDTLSPASNNTFTAGQKMSLTSNGAGATLTRCYFTIEYTITA